jgi:hypothetical protein
MLQGTALTESLRIGADIAVPDLRVNPTPGGPATSVAEFSAAAP